MRSSTVLFSCCRRPRPPRKGERSSVGTALGARRSRRDGRRGAHSERDRGARRGARPRPGRGSRRPRQAAGRSRPARVADSRCSLHGLARAERYGFWQTAGGCLSPYANGRHRAQRRPNRDRRSVATLAAPGDTLDIQALHQTRARRTPPALPRRHLKRAEHAALSDLGGSCGTGSGSGTITGPGGSLGTGSGSGTITGPGGSLGTGPGSGTSGGSGSVGGIGTASVGRPASCAWSIRSRIRS